MEKIYVKKDEGSMGIGALIIFIALILVAAIAAAVIIQTAARVRDDAQHTSDRISAQFLGMFNVISVYGNKSSSTSQIVNTLVITTKVVSTTDININNIILEVKTSKSVSHLILNRSIGTYTTYSEAQSAATEGEYSVYLPNLPPNPPWDPAKNEFYVEPNQIVVFVINLAAQNPSQQLTLHTQFNLYFVNDYTGAIGKMTMTTPPGYGDGGWVKIYPSP